MIERIEKLASYMNVTGAESEFTHYIYQSLSSKGIFAEIDCNGCVIARLSGTKKNNKKTMISVSIDIPGFIALYKENKTLYLTPTHKLLRGERRNKEIVDETGKKFVLKKSKFDEKEYTVTCQNGKIGKVFRHFPSFEKNNTQIIGMYVCKYVLIDFLLKLCEEKHEDDLLICFSTSYYSNEVSEANIAFREKPDTVILLSFSENSGENPIALVKNGKHFSSQKLLDLAKQSFENELILKVEEDEITKEISVFSSCFAEVITLALPYEKKDDNEVLSLNSIERFKTLINRLVK